MDIKVNDSGELLITDNDLELVEKVEAIKQDITTRLRTFKGEAFLNSTWGIDYYYIIFNKRIDKSTVDAHIKNTIKAVQGVTAVNGYMSQLNKSTRTLDITIAEITTVEGNFKYEVEI